MTTARDDDDNDDDDVDGVNVRLQMHRG
jgi:hypothetical protein